jgi:hypothetical protein
MTPSPYNPTSTNLWWISWTEYVKTHKLKLTFEWSNLDYTYSTGITFSYSTFTYTDTNLPWVTSYTIENATFDGEILVDTLYTHLWTWYTKWSVSDTSNTDYPRRFTFDFYKNDYSQLTYSYSVDFVLDTTLAIVNYVGYNGTRFGIVETNHLTDITVATLTEIAITTTLSWYYYFIPCTMNIKTITMSANSSVWASESGNWKLWVQSCTAKYSTTTEFVTDKIFKTNGSNYWSIVWTLTDGFLMTWTTNTSNKINFTCS